MKKYSFELSGISLEERFQKSARWTHINEYSYFMFFYQTGELEPFSCTLISAYGQEGADNRCAQSVKEYAAKGFNWDAVAVQFPEKYHSLPYVY